MQNNTNSFVFSGQYLTVDKGNGQHTELLKIKIYNYEQNEN